ncbi:DUF1616 domain-containing protein [Halomicroarcula sp. F28]|uniref:DUF1616 domain-containing protein n=1 Tax=Haloarcula salinisoli TaxID=2487746 RepID=UPI001C72C6F6|nr:DUF1616 domain-containing protein [Halomicroarcula salinisoli]MBX0285629.1 DUF1616 domain-containing protein [Halomicroarcula salinisoli]
MVRVRNGGRGIHTALLTLLDIAVVVGIALTTALLWQYTGALVTPLRVALGVPFVVFLPGYALTVAMFPGSASGQSSRPSLSALERLTLSVGLSVFVVPLVVLFLNFTAWGINPTPIRLALLSVTLAASAVAVVRRLRLPPTQRFVLPVGRPLRAVAARRVNVVIGVLLVLSVGVAGSALVQPGDSETFTEFSLLAENETGALVADDYPTEVSPNETATVHVGLGNEEGRTLNYTVVVEFQQFRSVDGERIVTSRTEVDRYRTTLGPGESSRTEQQFSPPAWASGDRVRLTFLLYTGSVSENPSLEDTYRKTHIWVDVPAQEDGV